MNYKLLSSLALSSLLLAACGQAEDGTKDASKKVEDAAKTAGEKAKNATEKVTSEDKTTEAPTTEKPSTKEETTTEDATTEQVTTEQNTTEQVTTEQVAVNFENVTDRATLEKIVYGNYDEGDKVTAYKSAVANGVIPQGNVMEGLASKAYESSLRVESGAEKSVYTSNPYPNNPNTAKYDYLFNSSNATDNIDPNYTPELNAQQSDTTTEDVDAWRENVPGGLSSGEIQMKNAIENGQYNEPDAQEIYNAILEKERQFGN